MGVGKLFCSCLFLFAIYVMISRAWMFGQPFIWVMMLLIINVKENVGVFPFNRQLEMSIGNGGVVEG